MRGGRCVDEVRSGVAACRSRVSRKANGPLADGASICHAEVRRMIRRRDWWEGRGDRVAEG
jgi:hypothetical protein